MKHVGFLQQTLPHFKRGLAIRKLVPMTQNWVTSRLSPCSPCSSQDGKKMGERPTFTWEETHIQWSTSASLAWPIHFPRTAAAVCLHKPPIFWHCQRFPTPWSHCLCSFACRFPLAWLPFYALQSQVLGSQFIHQKNELRVYMVGQVEEQCCTR